MPSAALSSSHFDTRQVVEREPKNVQAWIALGNDYFDSDQPKQAIEAYNKALEELNASPSPHGFPCKMSKKTP